MIKNYLHSLLIKLKIQDLIKDQANFRPKF